MGLAFAVMVGFSGCTEPTDSPAELPEQELDSTPGDTGGFVIDTSLDSGLDEQPAHTLTLEQWGQWSLSPFGGPYTTLTGSFQAREYLDGAVPPDSGDTADTGDYDSDMLRCAVKFKLVGAASESVCPGCDAAFDIGFYLLEGEPGDCLDPDMPGDGEVLRMGFSTSDEMIYYDYGGAGLWLPWWPATRAGDTLFFDWSAELGVSAPDLEEE